MSEPRRALYIGRFQVLHEGHLDVLRFIASRDDVDAIVVVLGSTQYDYTRKSPVGTWSANPFTAAERAEMIEAALAGQIDKPWTLHPVADVHDWPVWYAHLVASTPAFSYLYTSDREEAAFFGARGTEIRGFPRDRAFHAGTIRRWIALGQPWRHAVPAPVAAVLDRLDATSRLAELLTRDATNEAA